MTPTTHFEVVNLDTDEAIGLFARLDQARDLVRRDKIRAFEICACNIANDGETYGHIRREICDPYEGDDSRAAQSVGEQTVTA